MITNRGFSLIEVLISLFVLSIGSVGALKLYQYIEVEKYNAQTMLEAYQYAESQIATIQTFNTNSNCGSDLSFIVNECASAPQDHRFTLSWPAPRIEIKDSESELFAKIYDVDVSWNDRNGQEQSILIPVTVSKSSNMINH